MVMRSTVSLKAERLGEFLIERGREFQLRGRGNKGVGPKSFFSGTVDPGSQTNLTLPDKF